eukprot:460025-Alexandrium_andersonii.AAC.1
MEIDGKGKGKEPSTKASLGKGSDGKEPKRAQAGFDAQADKQEGKLLNMLGNLDLADPAEQVHLAPKAKRGSRRSVSTASRPEAVETLRRLRRLTFGAG